MTTTPIMPMPGLHLDVPFPTYRQWDAMNHHSLNAGPTPAHVRYALDHPDDGDTPALIVGRALHMALLEPSRFASEVVVAPSIDRRTKEGKAASIEFEAFVSGKTILTADQVADVRGMAAGVMAHEGCRALLEAPGIIEASMLWADPDTGLTMKGRADKFLTTAGTLIDIKSAERADDYSFARALRRYKYDQQAALYVAGLRACGRDVADVAFVVVEKSPPFLARVFELGEPTLALGQAFNREIIKAVAKAAKSGEWSGYPVIQTINAPRWAFSEPSGEQA